jgi:hypothetical protein
VKNYFGGTIAMGCSTGFMTEGEPGNSTSRNTFQKQYFAEPQKRQIPVS